MRKSKRPEYAVWANMIRRCETPHDVSYRYYGARGISVCARWRNSFDAFFEDMGARPSSDHSIDREDSNGNYEPGNCRWATETEQQRNRRNNRVLTLGERTQCLAAWSEETGISLRTIQTRLNAGLSASEVLKPTHMHGVEMRGVSWHRKARRWMAQSSRNGKRAYLGLHDTPEEARAAVEKHERDNPDKRKHLAERGIEVPEPGLYGINTKGLVTHGNS